MGGWHIHLVAGAHTHRLQSCPGMMFYSSHQAVYPFMSYRIPPVQVWLGLDNRKSAWRGDTTPQDVIEAIIMLSRRDVQELPLKQWWRRNTSPLRVPGNVLWCCDSGIERGEVWQGCLSKCLDQGKGHACIYICIKKNEMLQTHRFILYCTAVLTDKIFYLFIPYLLFCGSNKGEWRSLKVSLVKRNERLW